MVTITHIQEEKTMARTNEDVSIQSILEIMKESDYLMGQKGLITQMDYNGVKKVVNIEGREYKNYLKAVSYERLNAVASDTTIKDAISIFYHQYQMDYGATTEYAVRVYMDKRNRKIYYDLANDNMEYVLIEPDNISVQTMDFKNNPGFVFTRGNCMSEQVKYEDVADPVEAINLLDEFLNLPEKEKLLFKVWLIASLFPEITTPIPFFAGEPGTGKSSMVRIIDSIVDPSSNPLRNWDQSTPRDMGIDCRFSWNINYDNIRDIKPKYSDFLCQTVTGGSMTFRQLYQDDRQVNFDLRRRITLSTAQKIKLAPDLAQRLLFFHPSRLDYTKRIAEEDFDSMWEEYKPKILGGIYAFLALALEEFPEYKRTHHTYYRLSGFYLFGKMVAEWLDEENGMEYFCQIMRSQRQEQLVWKDNNDRLFYKVLLYYLEEYVKEEQYEISLKRLHSELCVLIDEDADCPVKYNDFDRLIDFSSFSKTIHTYTEKGYLQALGYELSFFQKGKNKTAMVSITKGKEF